MAKKKGLIVPFDEASKAKMLYNIMQAVERIKTCICKKRKL